MERHSNLHTWLAINISRDLRNKLDGVVEVGLENCIELKGEDTIVC